MKTSFGYGCLIVSFAASTAAVILSLTYYLFMRSRNRFGLAAMGLPLAVFPVSTGWFLSALRVISGFRAMATTTSSSLDWVLEMILEGNRCSYWSHVASLPPLGLLLVLAAVLWRRRLEPSTCCASTLRSAILVTLAVSSVLGAMIVAELGTRTLALPVAVAVPAGFLEDPNVPFLLPAKETLGLGDAASLATVSHIIADHLVACAIASFVMMGFCALAFIVNWVVSITVSFSRAPLVTGVVICVGATSLDVFQIERQAAMERQIRYIDAVVAQRALDEALRNAAREGRALDLHALMNRGLLWIDGAPRRRDQRAHGCGQRVAARRC